MFNQSTPYLFGVPMEVYSCSSGGLFYWFGCLISSKRRSYEGGVQVAGKQSHATGVEFFITRELMHA